MKAKDLYWLTPISILLLFGVKDGWLGIIFIIMVLCSLRSGRDDNRSKSREVYLSKISDPKAKEEARIKLEQDNVRIKEKGSII